jgi:hypothetical protein
MTCFRVFSALRSLSSITLLDDFGTFLVQKLVATIRAKELDLLAPKFLIMAIKFALALRADYPENFGHNSPRYQFCDNSKS